MSIQIQVRRDTTDNWETFNPVLGAGELGVVTDNPDYLKIGDGSTPWNALTPWSRNNQSLTKQVVVGDSGFGTSLLTSVATGGAGTAEHLFTVGADCTNVAALFDHWYTQVTVNPKTDVDPAGSISFNASLRIVSSSIASNIIGTIYRLTFNGRTSVTLDPGGKVISDQLGISLAAGDRVAVRTYLASGTAYSPRPTWYNWNSAAVGGFTSTTDLTAPGSSAVTSAGGFHYGPSALLGRPQDSSAAKSVVLFGDSIGYSIGDFAAITKPDLGAGGFVLRALSGHAGLLNLSVSGDLVNYFLSSDGSFRRMSVAGLANSAIIEGGTNDTIQGYTAAEIQAKVLELAIKARRQGVGKVFIVTLMPRTTSTDGWATTTNQTPLPASEPERLLHNAWVRADCPIDPTSLAPVLPGTPFALLAGQNGHPITGFFDTASKVESSLNSGFWIPARRVATGSINSGSNVLTSSDASFTNTAQENGGDLGGTIQVMGAGAAGAPLGAQPYAVSSTTSVSLTAAASTTVSGAVIVLGCMTQEGVHPSPRGHDLASTAIDVSRL